MYDLDDVSDSSDGAAYLMGISADELARHAGCCSAAPRTIDRLDQPCYLKANVRCDLPWDQMVQLRDELRLAFPAFDFVFPMLHGPFIDILPAGWSKGRAVEVLAERLGLSRDEIMAFGDSENDIAMFEAVAYPVAVSNASADASAAACCHIGSAEDDAVADALFAVAEAAVTGDLPDFLCS